jgi:hypothetical protein
METKMKLKVIVSIFAARANFNLSCDTGKMAHQQNKTELLLISHFSLIDTLGTVGVEA